MKTRSQGAVRQGHGIWVSLLEEREDREKFEEGTRPAVIEGQRGGVWRGAEERDEVDGKCSSIERVFHRKSVVRK